MKKVYERPVMMAEEYTTNAYCNSCGETFTTLTLDSNNKYSSSNNSGRWFSNGSGFTKDDLYHEFDGDNISGTTNGVCGPGGYVEQGHNVVSNIWQCTCHPDDPWYLEYSHYYSVHANHKATYFLYKEANGISGCQITQNASSWPSKDSVSDYNVAQVVFSTNTTEVSNS